MILTDIENYYSSNFHKPFYMAVGDDEYNSYKTSLEKTGVDFICLSSCCNEYDKKPDLDKFRGLLRTADVDCDSNRVVVLGLGEYLALEGYSFANDFLLEMTNFNLGFAHVVFLLRGVTSIVKALVNNDPRYLNRQVAMSKETGSSLAFNFSTMDLRMFEKSGIKSALIGVENGNTSPICINTDIVFPNSMFQIVRIKDSFEAINKKNSQVGLCRDYGDEEQWDTLLSEINRFGSIEKVFDHYQLTYLLSNSFYSFYSKQGYNAWLSFLYLKVNCKNLSNKYLKFVCEISKNYDEYQRNVLNAIIGIPHLDDNFNELYLSRKRLVQQFPESDISVFVSNNRLNIEESIYKLTDNTNVEREEIISYCSQHGIVKNISFIYPALAAYLNKYIFCGGALNDLLTDYFETYKALKIANTITPQFLSQVDKIALSRDFNRLRTRDELVSAIDTKDAFLCWIDALGVEYLSFISDIALKKGLAVSISIGRAELPTITGINKKFYELWPNESKRKIDDLDDVKHNEKGGYKYGVNNPYPIHLSKELSILQEAIDEAATELGLYNYDRYIIASDHGASRLAVIHKKEEKYETDTIGKHSGRCCKSFANCDLPFATEENGYIVLADYGRFKGSRAANVEVHGGASLEEVVVPVITLSLRDSSIVIQVVEKAIKADYKSGVSFTLFVNKQVSSSITVDYNGKRYKTSKKDSYHYLVSIEDIKKSGTYSVDIYLGEALISDLSLSVSSKSGSTNDDFDDLF